MKKSAWQIFSSLGRRFFNFFPQKITAETSPTHSGGKNILNFSNFSKNNFRMKKKTRMKLFFEKFHFQKLFIPPGHVGDVLLKFRRNTNIPTPREKRAIPMMWGSVEARLFFSHGVGWGFPERMDGVFLLNFRRKTICFHGSVFVFFFADFNPPNKICPTGMSLLSWVTSPHQRIC